MGKMARTVKMNGTEAVVITQKLERVVREAQAKANDNGGPLTVLWDSRGGQFLVITSLSYYLTITYRRNLRIYVHTQDIGDKDRIACALDYHHFHEGRHGDSISIAYDKTDSEIVACMMLERWEDVFDKVGEVLVNVRELPNRADDDYVRWLLENRARVFRERIDWENLGGAGWVAILSKFPEYANRCAWNRLSTWDWVRLLKDHPEFSNRCAWNDLGDFDWVDILRDHPEFAQKCDFSTFGRIKSFRSWARQTATFELLKLMPDRAQNVSLEEITGDEWVELIGQHNELIHLCDWGKFSYRHMKTLSGQGVDFGGDCDWSKVEFTGRDLASFLQDAPPWREKYEEDKRIIDATCLMTLTEEVVKRALNERWSIAKLTADEWTEVLKRRPEMDTYLPSDIVDKVHWVSVVIEQPNLLRSDHCSINLGDMAEETKKVLWNRCGKLFEDKTGFVKSSLGAELNINQHV